MAPTKGPPPKGSQTISSFFQRVDKPAGQGASSSNTAADCSTGEDGDIASPMGAKRQSGSPSTPQLAKRRRVSMSSSSKLEHWRYIRPPTDSQQEQDDTAHDEQTGVDLPDDIQPADPARHARFVKLLYASSRSELDKGYGYLSLERNGIDAITSNTASSRGLQSRDEQQALKEPRAPDEEEEEDSDEPQLITSLSTFAHEDTNSKTSKSMPQAKSTSARTSKGKGRAKDDTNSASNNDMSYTPLEKQILELKQSYPGVLLIIEVGYKLKFYGDDARIASRELNIACFPEKHLLTAMIPVHRLHVHIRKLIAAGHKVGLVRQTETRALKAASTTKSQPFTRALTAMYTASTWIDDLENNAGLLAQGDPAQEGGLEEPTALRSVVCVMERPEGGGGPDERVSIGLVSVSVSTGDVVYDQFVDGNLRSELETRIAHLDPAELLLPDPKGKFALSSQTERLLKHIAASNVDSRGRSSLRVERISGPKLTHNEAVQWLEDFCSGRPSGPAHQRSGNGKAPLIRTSSAMDLDAVPQTDPSDNDSAASVLPTILRLPHLSLIALAHLIKHISAFFSLTSVFSQPTNFTSFENRTTMLLTANTIHNLEIFQNSTDGKRRGSLIWLLDRCKTMMGRRQLRRWVARPLIDLPALQARVDAVEELGRPQCTIGPKLATMLQGTPDLERGLAKLNYGTLTPTELATFLLALNRITHEFSDVETPADVTSGSELVNSNVAALPSAKDLVRKTLAMINVAAARQGEKKDLFVDPDLYPDIQDAKDNILVMESELREHLKEVRKQLKRPKLEYISVAGNEFLIEVRAADATKVPAGWLRISATKSMVRFHTPKVRELLQEREQHKEMLDAAAEAAYKDFLNTIKQGYVDLRNVVASLSTLDSLLSLVQVALLPGYCKPTFNENNITRIEGLRHPMSEQLMETDFVPNDVTLGDLETTSANTILLTGSNMGGKSSIARATALISVLAQIGSYVPADSADLPLHDAILTRMGASDMLAKGRSTFMVEVVETAEIMRAATPQSLVIIDELGRGTSTYDGLAIAYAVLEYLVLGEPGTPRERSKSPQMFFITHHFQLCELEGMPRFAGAIRNMHMAVMEVAPLHATSSRDHDEEEQQQGRQEPSEGSEPEIVFLYKLAAGPASKSLGINCARMAGLPEPVLISAAQKSREMEIWEGKEVAIRREASERRLLRSLFGPHTNVDAQELVAVKDILAAS
ncbi:Mismatch repair protein msh3 [Tilletia horrida]|nr:Mismatch repair protein msh3 [Tilletia horrida]